MSSTAAVSLAPMLSCEGASGTVPPMRDQAPVEGYLDRASYAPGDPVVMHVHALQGSFSYSVFRLGQDQQSLAIVENLRGIRRVYPHRAFAVGAGWTPSCTFNLPGDWPSGLYVVKLKSTPHDAPEKAFHMPFVPFMAAG